MAKAFFSHSMYVTKELLNLVTDIRTGRAHVPKGTKRLWRKLVVMALGVGMLFWSYTFVLGLVLIVLAFLGLFIQPLVKTASRVTESRQLRYLYKTTYSVSDEGLRAKSHNLDSKIGWNFVALYDLIDDWLVVMDHDGHSYFYPISLMKKRLVFEKFEAMLKQHTKREPQMSGAR